MSVTNYSVVLNGQGAKTLPNGDTLTQAQLNYGLFDYFHSKADDHLNADITLSGLVNLRAIVMGPDLSKDSSIDVTLNDKTSGPVASQVDLMFFFGVDSADITLDRTKVRYLTGDGEDFKVTYGRETISSVDLYATNNTIVGNDLPGAHVDKMFLRGKNDVTLTDGYFGTLDLGGAGSDRVVVGEDATLVSMRAAGKVVDLNILGNGIVEAIKFNNSTADIDMSARSSVYTIQIDNGTYDIDSAGGSITSISGFNSTLNIDAKAVSSISLAGAMAARSHDLTFDGWVGSLNISNSRAVGAGDQITDLTLNGGAGAVRLGFGDDLVTVGDNYVELLSTGRGKDTVILGSGSASMVRTGANNDTIVLGNMGANEGVVINGGLGRDILDARNYRGEIIWDVDAKEVRSVDSKFGYFRAENIELVIGGNFSSDTTNPTPDTQGSRLKQVGTNSSDNLVGLNSNDLLIGRGGSDVLTGNGGQDRLQGGNGSDQLSGGDGRDQLAGGRGNDSMRGGDGADTFIFDRRTGEDIIYDFEAGVDHIKLNQQSGGFNSLQIVSISGGQLIIHDQGVIEVQGLGNQRLDADDFIL